MKYFTKEWYEANQAADWCLRVSVSKNAEQFSEEYYQDLYMRRRRAFVKQHKEEEGFDKIAAEVAFMRQHEETIKKMEALLPIEITAEVADMRVLALDIATKEVRQRLKAWCEAQKASANVPEGVEDDGDTLQGCSIAGWEVKENTLTLTLRGTVKRAVFTGYQILEQEGYPLGAVYLKGESYAMEGGREYHALLQKKDGTLAYLTIFAEKLTIIK